MRISCPPDTSTSSFSSRSSETDTGTSRIFSLRRCAVTVTVSSWLAAGAVSAATSSAYAEPIGKAADNASMAALLAHKRLCILDILIMLFPRSLKKELRNLSFLQPVSGMCTALDDRLHHPGAAARADVPPLSASLALSWLSHGLTAVPAASLGCLMNANFSVRRHFISRGLCAARILLCKIFIR